MRTISLNTHYIVLLRNPRVQQIQTLASQLGYNKSLMEAYQDCMKTPYSYLVLNLCPHDVDDYKMTKQLYRRQLLISYDQCSQMLSESSRIPTFIYRY